MVEEAKPKRNRVLLGCGAAFAVAIVAFVLWLYPVYAAFRDEGFFDEQKMRQYSGDSTANLKAMYQALTLYHDSEGQFPEADGWMDAAWLRLKTADMTEDETRKKMVSPTLQGMADEYGYAFNQAVSGKFRDEIENPERTVLIFDSQATEWNASGDPAKDAADPARPGGNLAVTVTGEVLPLSELLTPAK